MDMKKLIPVRNRNNGITTYQLPDMHIVRQFGFNETKRIPFDEIMALQYAPGGDYMLSNLLVIEDEEALEALNMNVEPEYFYTENTVKDLLLKGTYDEFADFLDFAPEGAIEMVKDIAVKMEIPDMHKREMIEKKTGFSVNNAINVNRIMDADDNKDKNAEESASKQRRVPLNDKKEEAPARRVAAPQKYNVVSTTK